MPDPRLFTVKQCQPSYAGNSGANIMNATNIRRDFFNAVGKIGDIQALNDIKAGKIGAGLRNLASISNAIRVGKGALPSIIGSSIDAGANWVLGQTGIASTVVAAVKQFNPGIANIAYGQAKSVYQMVKGGSFRTANIPGVLQDLQNLERLGRNIFTPGQGDVNGQLTERCDASPYAVDLIARAPKYKFLFVVQFVPAAGYEDLGNGYGPLDIAFTIKHCTRPNIRFAHDDVNYYNFRTKVVTKTEFEDMSMAFHDDTNNIAGTFYRSYLRAMSPITGMTPEETMPDILEASGMDFVDWTLSQQDVYGSIRGSSYASDGGLLASESKNIFKEIRIYHLHDYGQRMNVYRFANPRISALSLDDLDMAVGNEGSEMSITFNYDSLYMDADVDVATTRRYNIGQLQRGAVYPLKSNANGAQAGYDSVQPGIVVPSSIESGLNTLRNGTNFISQASNAATAAVSDLGTKFSNALNSLPKFG